jgi:16S rRNA (guanine527-N7)-methyltransferase
MNPAIDRASLQVRLRAGTRALGLAPSEATLDRLLDYLELLVRWNAVYNLTAVRDPAEMVERHLLDSLAIAPYVSGATLADLGSGAGLPGIPLALVAADRQHVLIDSNGKKARFLREAVRTLGLGNVRVEHARVENLRGSFDCITARAFTGLPRMLDLAGHLLAPDGWWLAMKGALDPVEMTTLPAGFTITEARALDVPGLGARRHLVIIRRTATVVTAHEHAA